jgi:hypothetical protein
MALLSLKLDQLFMLLVPELVVSILVAPELAVTVPSESNFVQNSLSIKSNFVIDMKRLLPTNPLPKRFVLFVSVWHNAMAIGSFKLENLFMLHVPLLIMFCHAQHALLRKTTKWVDVGSQKRRSVLLSS